MGIEEVYLVVFVGINGTSVDTNGDVIALDGSSVWRINPENPDFVTFGNQGSMPSSLSDSTGIVVDLNGDYLVVDFFPQ